MMGITGALSSLGINERPSDTVNLPRNCSLPNLTSGAKAPVPGKFGNYCDEEMDSPIDFSKKYSETKSAETTGIFTMYAETDLDQPTDYSLRYAEDDTDSDGCSKIPKTEFVQDTIKTYCTEDTPYETPFNFSTSTSMSDLRLEKLDRESKNPNVTVTISKSNKGAKSEFSSGLMSPEKPVNYCEEGTPGYFSRVASCGSLNSIPVSEAVKQELKEDTGTGDKTCGKESRRIGGSKFPVETKAVKFEEVVNYAEETPLMFSRSSSLASLDSIEQHSIHDDRSSIISDFSRLTSGLISPSELPDSPSQTIPPSPKPRKNPLLAMSKKATEVEPVPPPVVPPPPKPSVFEDVVKKFKMESTPLQFSTATSLSSLIDDDVDPTRTKNCQTQVKEEELPNLDINSESSEDEDILAACINIGMKNNRYSQVKSNSPPPKEGSFKFSQSGEIGGGSNSDATQSTIRKDVTGDSVRTYCTEDTPAILSQAGSNSDLSLLSMPVESKVVDNTIEEKSNEESEEPILKTEDEMPTNSSLENGIEKDLSRHSSFSSLSNSSHESEEALLHECILAGMPKAKEENEKSLQDLGKTIESSDDEEDDENILADCINSGMKNNRYSQVSNYNKSLPRKCAIKNIKPEVVNDSIKSYYTEGTPIGLSHAGSGSDLSVLLSSVQVHENDTGQEKDDLSDFNSNFSDDDDESLLMECVRYGMAKIAGSSAFNQLHKVEKGPLARNYLQESPKRASEKIKVDLNISVENNVSDDDEADIDDDDEDSRSMSSFLSDGSYESEQVLLQECILAGMPKRPPPRRPQSADLTAAEKALLQQCILEGMLKCRNNGAQGGAAKPPPTENAAGNSDLTETERALLRQCILAGMPKNKNLSVGGPSREAVSHNHHASSTTSTTTTELTESERLLLQQCILAGMPKERGKQGSRRSLKEEPRGEGVGHACCIHCPRNNRSGSGSHSGGGSRRRRYRSTREVNILYVTNQILAMKEVIDRPREEWV